ncbi:MAG: hypothetical protein A2725_03650 [Candidatus Magasanikbacteria bacterium RIFCSPHIGHO2_01_FULL_33_34]|uniref:GGDEF domain-containing protein n=1 Tax=Candidatus Magasanikbacteria bacterium RIFCSPHIGHO2_01_FULL_33_34 TaxID=1798671 RepID=A0A1F6LHB0_9BACT|nr:MAG: hypothetical protein A2725_03650 [Candidatus Magasanikbacteria bacterium RIFCSPHIGHO2_01_FULL_33_34]OGH65066.1 MAG: hypothetical protein A3B83_03410 [Candidatus Magasanikbacteria bacterium RIFCSPHIGHO2_02_FULL_33_17]OGH75390.1 MAG: hypothetical protein A3A89_04755 [Candidatus Magasanikbacteria bacterium RIFCSPLOWO2_01_FULL_33_34]OGH81449.1 MAG: hypothetical protein A3F93_02545 [Candidatus Magasanikbacteria bacterium RIFCSPLOWO2_12_FULL_34_7]
MSIESGGYNPNNMPELSYEEKMQAEREAFDKRMEKFAEELGVSKETIIQSYAVEEDNLRSEEPDEPTSIYESGPGSKVIERSIKETILERIKGQTDSLTKLPNRVALEKDLERRKRENKEFSFIMIDVDKFKSINDNYGHAGGDYVLKTLAEVLKNTLREGDIVTRYGGEELVVLAANANGSGPEVAEKLRRAVAKYEFKYEGKKIDVTISAGVNAPQNEVADLEALKIKSDKALYAAKGEFGASVLEGENIEPGHEKEPSRNQVWYYDKDGILKKYTKPE